MATKKKRQDLEEAFEGILRTIIDEWYERVSSYYVTEPSTGVGPDADAELKRFHDDNGHRIKFNKDDLDFTYGLRSVRAGDSLHLDVSVNNKVDEFNYEVFKRRLFEHYRAAGRSRISRPAQLKGLALEDVFQLESGFDEAFTVERRGKRADIMRLSFCINKDHLDALAADPDDTKQLIESYCVAPFRNIYARVYRSNT